MTKDIIAFSS